MITVAQAKEHLHILHADDDAQLEDLCTWAFATAMKFCGEGWDEYAAELADAQVALIRWRYFTDVEVPIDPVSKLPEAFVALAGPYRTPTVA